MILVQLRQALLRLDESERRVARQREIVAELELASAADLVTARTLLQRFEDVHASHIADRDRIERELAQVTA